MATPPAHANETWPLQDDDDEYIQDFEDTFWASGCGCFGGLCWWRRNTNGYMVQVQEDQVRSESWVTRKAKKLKEISEVLAGPRWKNFIRRFSKKRRSMMMQFQYDPHSYQLNFDQREAGAGFPDFSARFAAPAAAIPQRGPGSDKQPGLVQHCELAYIFM